MTIESHSEQVGVDVHFSTDECELFIRLASDLDKLRPAGEEPAARVEGAQSYFSLSAELGKRIRALAQKR